ncbi:MAG: 30S ribosomal protein S9 [Fibrobacterota bacterium]
MAEKKNVNCTIGRRKNAVARVRMFPGGESILVNGRELMEYFKNERLKIEVEKPLRITEKFGQYSVKATLTSGGLSGQADALKLGIARALCVAEPALRTILKKAGLLTRDPRIVERKKYGRSGARKRYQFSKR